MKPDFGAVSKQRITFLPTPIYHHVKTSNDARSILARAEYAMQTGDRKHAHALAVQAGGLIAQIIEATE